jgi:hypothetical protein
MNLFGGEGAIGGTRLIEVKMKLLENKIWEMPR